MIESQCTQWAEEVENAIASVVVVVRGERGADRTDVSATLDGKSLGRRWVGVAIELNPGEHTLTIEAPGLKAQHQHFVAVEGEKRRRIVVQLPARKKTNVLPRPAPQPKPVEWTAGWIVMGTSLAVLTAFAALAVAAKLEYDDLRKSCSPSCEESEVQPLRTKALVADIALGVGAVGVGVGIYLLVASAGHANALTVTAGGRF